MVIFGVSIIWAGNGMDGCKSWDGIHIWEKFTVYMTNRNNQKSV